MHALIDVILKPTSKSYKPHYISNWSFARALTSDQKIDQRIQINNFPGIHSNVSRESYSFKLFDLPLLRCIPGMKVKQGYMAYRKWGKIRWAKLSWFLRLWRGPWKFFREYFTQAIIDYIPDQWTAKVFPRNTS